MYLYLQLPAGGIKYIHALGKHFAVFRSEESGEAFVTDAYCPRLGTNLTTATAQVKGDCVECPDDKWTFDGKYERCTGIPDESKVSLIIDVNK
jgi:nitrite reductase/ring-hydroxylating ferredoxin subunit